MTHTANHYRQLPVTLASGSGAWASDVDGRRYLDMLAGHGALNFGHCDPDLLAVARSRATATGDRGGGLAVGVAQLAEERR